MKDWTQNKQAVLTICLILLVPVGAGFWAVERNNVINLREAQTEEAWLRYDSSITACERGNLIQQDNNRYLRGLKESVTILNVYLDSAASFRRRTDNVDLANDARMARLALRGIIGELKPAELVDCEKVILKPRYPRPDGS